MRVSSIFVSLCVLWFNIESHTCSPIPARQVLQTCESCVQVDIPGLPKQNVGLSFADSESRVEESRFGPENQMYNGSLSLRGPHYKVTGDFDKRTGFYGAAVGEFQVGTGQHKSRVQYLSSGLEIGRGAMIRLSTANWELATPTHGFNVGYYYDTGVMFDGKDVEAKVVGIGAKIGASAVQLCFVVCVGFNW